MLNSMCSPELSFNSGSMAKSPHAFVAYDDEEKDIRPVSFICKFPPKWREEGWNKRYLYKVFWSPVEDDSPTKMLKREPTIPVFERGATRNQAGYHRASVLMVKESEEELLQELDSGKRISVGLSKYQFTSYDEGQSKSQVQTAAKKYQSSKAAPSNKKNGKPVVLKKKKVVEVKKKTDRGNCSPNIDDLRERLKLRFPATSQLAEGMQKQDGNSSSGAESVSLKSDPTHSIESKNKLQELGSENRLSMFSKNSKKTDNGELGKKDKNDSDNDDSVELGKQEDEQLDSDELLEIDNEESDKAGSEELDKTIPVTPDSASHSKGEQRSSSRGSFKRKVFPESDSSSDEGKQMKLDPDYTPRKYMVVKESLAIQKATINRLTELNLKLQEKINKVEEDFDKFKANCRCGRRDMKSTNIVESTKHEKSSSKSDSTQPKKGNGEDSSSFNEWSNNESVPTQELCQVVHDCSDDDTACWDAFPSQGLREMVRNIPEGTKKDIKFIKEASIIIFGPETLASSSILGTKKGSKAKGEDVKIARPALAKEKLCTIKDLLMSRVMKEEKLSKAAAEEHERCSQKRLFEAIRDAQKWCRERGYGSGIKNDNVNLDLFVKSKK